MKKIGTNFCILPLLNENGDGLLFMAEGYTFSILWSKRNYFLFDPHSHGAFSDIGSSVRQLQNYVYDVYFPDTPNLYIINYNMSI